MSKLLLLFFVINIVLTSCSVTKVVQKSTATAKAVSNGGSSSAAASATSLTKINTNSKQGGTNDLHINTKYGNNNNEYPIVNEDPNKINENNINDRNYMNNHRGNVGNEHYNNNNDDDKFDVDETETDDDDDINDKDDDINDKDDDINDKDDDINDKDDDINDKDDDLYDKDDDINDDNDNDNDGNKFICNSKGCNCKGCNGALRKMIDAANYFALLSMKYQLNTYTTEIVSAPLNTFFMICVYALYTVGDTWERAKVFCGVETKEQIRCGLDVFSEFTENLPRGIKYLFGSVYASDNIFTKPFRRDVREIVSGRALNFNFSDVEDLPWIHKKVNKDIARQTKNKIRDALASSSIFKFDPNAGKVVLSSGIFLEGKYERAFDLTNLTVKEYTDLYGEIIHVPFVYQVDILKYAYVKKLKSQVLSVPFKDKGFDAIVMLPRNASTESLLELAENLQVPGILRTIRNKLRPHCVEYQTPVSEGVSARIDMGEIMRETNLHVLFDPKTNEVENAYGQRLNEYISDIVQKVVIKPDPSGDKPPSNVCPDVPGGSHNLKKIKFVVDHPAIILIGDCHLIRFARIFYK